MAEQGQSHEGRRPVRAVSLWLGRRRGRWGLISSGILVGLLLWAPLLFLLGDPRISSIVPVLDGAGPPVLVARSQFQMMAEMPLESLAQAPREGLLPSTMAQVKAVQPALWAMAMPDVREALGILPGPAMVVPTPIPGRGEPAEAPPPPAEPLFSYPERMVPGSPSATVAQVMNPTKDLLVAQVTPQVAADQGSQLCPALRTAIVSVVSGKAPKMVMGGKLINMLNGATKPMVMEAGERYNLVILISVPQDAGNEYQGVSCTVDFTLQAQGL